MSEARNMQDGEDALAAFQRGDVAHLMHKAQCSMLNE